MSSEGFFLPPPLPEKKLPFLPVIRTPTNGSQRLIVISTDVIFVRIHREGKHPVRCCGEDCAVPGCPQTGKRQGYFEIQSLATGNLAMFEITEDTYHRLREISVESGLCFRGLQLEFERRQQGKIKYIHVAVIGPVARDRDIPIARNMRPFVDRLFKNKVSARKGNVN